MSDEQNTTDRNDNGTFSHGNAFWRMRDTHGRSSIFDTDDDLWRACVAYFDWAAANPLNEDKVFSFQGKQTHEPGALMRAFTISGLCIHLCITEETWRAWRRDRTDLKPTIAAAEAVIRTQKFEGAAAGLLNASIIARDLGLSDKQEVTGKDGEPIKTQDVSQIEVARRIAFVMAQAMNELEPKAED